MAANTTTSHSIERSIARHRVELDRALADLGGMAEDVSRIANLLIDTLRTGHTVLLAGNGGSAAEAQHFSAELVGRYKRERRPYAALALSTDTSIITAIGNDYGFDQVFARQVGALGRTSDVLVLFSTSGESRNLLLAAEAARQFGISVVAVTGPHESSLSAAADVSLRAPGADGATVQEIHTVVTHLVCEAVEAALADEILV